MSKEERYGMQMRRDRAQAMVIRKDSIKIKKTAHTPKKRSVGCFG